MEDDQLSPGFTGRASLAVMRRVTAAMAAPIARNARAIIHDEDMSGVAWTVWNVFSHDDAVDELTTAEVSGRSNGTCAAHLLAQACSARD
jgi:hypothetical protein